MKKKQYDQCIIFGNKLRLLRKQRHVTMKELGKRVGLHESTVARYEKGEISSISIETAKAFAEALSVPPEFLSGWDEDSDNNTKELEIIYNDYFPLHYSTNLSAGTLDELLDSEPDAVVYVPIKYQMLRDRLNAFKVNGDSMNNVIPDGSIVITESIDNALDIKNGTIVVAWIDGCATIKRLYKADNGLSLMPDSTDKSFQPILVSDDKQVKIIGKVIWHMNPDNIEKYY